MIDLKEFIGETVVPEDVEWKGKTKTFYFAELCAEDAENLFIQDDPAKKNGKKVRARIVAQVLRDESGEKCITFEEAQKTIPSPLLTKLFNISVKVNGAGKDDETKKE